MFEHLGMIAKPPISIMIAYRGLCCKAVYGLPYYVVTKFYII